MSELETRTHERTGGHVAAQMDEYLAGRLESDAEVAFEAHLLVCDECFPAYLIRTLDGL